MYFGWGSVQRRQRRRLGCPFHRIALPEHCTCGLVQCQSQASGADSCRNRLGTQKSHRHEVRVISEYNMPKPCSNRQACAALLAIGGNYSLARVSQLSAVAQMRGLCPRATAVDCL